MPLSWPHYVVGLRHLDRARARESLMHASATRVAQAEAKHWRAWYRDTSHHAGW
jgi:hypothetical protein